MKTRFAIAMTASLTALAVIAALLLGASVAGAQSEGPGAGVPAHVTGRVARTFYSTVILTNSASISTASPLRVFGTDISSVGGYAFADVFVTADVMGAGTPTFIITPQLSIDAGVNGWADASYVWVNNTTSVVTSTGVLTASSASALTESTYRVTLTADGTKYFRMPIVGEYLRFKFSVTGLTTDILTPTIKVMLRND